MKGIAALNLFFRINPPEMTEEETDGIKRLPPETLEYIFSFLEVPSDLCSAELICRSWKALVYNMKIDYFSCFYGYRRKEDDDPFLIDIESCFKPAPFTSFLDVYKIQRMSEKEGNSFL